MSVIRVVYTGKFGVNLNSMKHLFLLLSLTAGTYAQAQQWDLMPLPPAPRYDDVFFIDDNVGWLVGGDSGYIYKTVDAGLSWTPQIHFNGQKYLRSIEFATPQLGFCGSLDSSFFKTTDGGLTWTDIAGSINPKPAGICGLSAPTANVIYGCGVWSAPGFVVKSTDGGNTWTRIDLSAYATNLVDIHFPDAQHGFVSGRANPLSDGGVILYTADGGTTWTVKHKTYVAQDYVWKMQTYNGKNFYASIEAGPAATHIRWLQSVDSGATWQTNHINGVNSYVQTIGFLDSLHGWTGGSFLYATEDGGTTWNQVAVGSSFNRFFRVNNNTAFLTGKGLYKYYSGGVVGLSEALPYDEVHDLHVYPNPTYDRVEVVMYIHNKTYGRLQLFDAAGNPVRTLYDGPVQQGTLNFTASLAELPAGTYILVLKTNEGNIERRIMKI